MINISSYHKKLPGVIASEIDDIVQSPCPDMIKSTPWKTVSLLLYPPPHVRTKHQHINIFTTLVDSSPRHHPSLSIPFSSSTKKPTFIEQRGGEKISVSFTRKKNSFSLFRGKESKRNFLSRVRLDNFVQLGKRILYLRGREGLGRVRVFSRFLNIWKHRIAGPTNTSSSSSSNPFISTTSWFYKCERFQ